jgi:hypothetical protein
MSLQRSRIPNIFKHHACIGTGVPHPWLATLARQDGVVDLSSGRRVINFPTLPLKTREEWGTQSTRVRG